ncbi:MAG: xanthine dehydrogenase family protein molybdopterin-binding subunit [Spirochaetales bacterium]
MAKSVRQEIKGQSDFISDIYVRGMLYATTIRSPFARATIQSIDISELPEGITCVTARDIPGKNEMKIDGESMPLLALHETRFVGEAVALIAGPSQRAVLDALSGISVEYDEQSPALAFSHPLEAQLERRRIGERGDVAASLGRSDNVVEGSYRTGIQEHLYNEPQGAVVEPASKKRFIVRCATQWPFHVRSNVAEALGIPEQRVVVRPADTGITLDGKLWYPSLVAAHAALLSQAAGAPVKLVYSNIEDYRYTSKRAPFYFRIATGIGEDGRLEAAQVESFYNAGAYPLFTAEMTEQVVASIFPHYRCANLRISTGAVETNLPPLNVMSGFGAASAFFAAETHVSRVAEIAQTDPLVWRRENVVYAKEGKRTKATLRWERVNSVLEAIGKESDFSRKHAAYELQKKRRDEFVDLRRPTRGIGVALASQGGGFGGAREGKYGGSIVLRLDSDGKATLKTSAIPGSPSVHQAWRRIIAEELELGLGDVRIEPPQTDAVPDSGPSTLSRNVVVITRLIEQAANAIQKQRFRKPLPIEVRKASKQNKATAFDYERLTGSPYGEVAFGAAAVEVTVDPITFETSVDNLWLAVDAGRILDEAETRRNLEMSVHQALEWSTHEIVSFRIGAIDPRSYLAYRNINEPILPQIAIDVRPSPEKGTLGIGDLPQSCVPAALAAAVSQATGRYMDQVPTNPALIHGYMEPA